MSEVDPGQFEERSYHEDLEKLINDLETLACRVNEDYALGVTDGFDHSDPQLDMGGELKTEPFFNVERTRESYISPRFGEIHGDVITTSYQVGGIISSFKTSFDNFPAHIQEHLLEAVESEPEDAWLETLRDKDTSIVIQYRYSHTIFQDGTITPSSDLFILVDDDVFQIPEVPHAQFAAPLAQGTDQTPGEFDMSEFESMFDTESLLTVGALEKQLITRREERQILEMFYAQIDGIRFLTQQARLAVVRNTINYLYGERTI